MTVKERDWEKSLLERRLDHSKEHHLDVGISERGSFAASWLVALVAHVALLGKIAGLARRSKLVELATYSRYNFFVKSHNIHNI